MTKISVGDKRQRNEPNSFIGQIRYSIALAVKIVQPYSIFLGVFGLTMMFVTGIDTWITLTGIAKWIVDSWAHFSEALARALHDVLSIEINSHATTIVTSIASYLIILLSSVDVQARIGDPDDFVADPYKNEAKDAAISIFTVYIATIIIIGVPLLTQTPSTTLARDDIAITWIALLLYMLCSFVAVVIGLNPAKVFTKIGVAAGAAVAIVLASTAHDWLKEARVFLDSVS